MDSPNDFSVLRSGGRGSRLGNITIILTGVAALTATLLTVVAVWLQLKNYRKPLLQRYVVRILIMVPFFSAASWASLMSTKASSWIEPFRDVYEAFVIYAFFQLLINFIGGERALIILMHGRPPVSHPWPLNGCFNKVDISDPHTFLAIKRGILQYAWLKPMLAIATIVMKATDTYQEGYIGLNSGYLWSGIIYNISITVSLYSLAMFWICMSDDLQPFRPMPKFLCIKGIIFASYWQGFMLSILVWLGAIPDDVPGYTPDNLAASIQDALICFEMPIFAILHWMPMKFALRDAFGTVDLVQDAKDTFVGAKYEYRYFDAGDDVLAHEESQQRAKRIKEGMRYERGGKGKYWIPKPGGDSQTPLLGAADGNPGRSGSNSDSDHSQPRTYGTTSDGMEGDATLDADDERLYTNARALEFGDWNYPVITAHRATREDRLYGEPSIITSSTNRNLLQPTKEHRKRRKEKVREIQRESQTQHAVEDDSADDGEASSGPVRVVKQAMALQKSNSSSDDKADPSQLVDLVVEDEEAEQVERIRARKEGSPEWNKSDVKHFVETYPADGEAEEVREGNEPAQVPNRNPDQQHTLDTSFAVGSSEDDSSADEADPSRHFERRDYTGEEGPRSARTHPEDEGTTVWASD